mgnify:CR=1 FL=1|jgi:hypothetical protein
MDDKVKKEIRDYDNYIKLLNKRNEIGKNNFIREINKGLGDEIKSELTLNKKEKGSKLKNFFKKIFKIF